MWNKNLKIKYENIQLLLISHSQKSPTKEGPQRYNIVTSEKRLTKNEVDTS
jgi:hypothetical protein